MKLQTQIPFTKAKNQIDYNSQLLLLGSCFVENMGEKFNYFKFQSVQNPFGILFHPLAIEKLLFRAVHQEKYVDDDVFFLNERWHCFDAHSSLSSTSKEQLLENLNQSLKKTLQQLKQATHVVITLGTAWVYESTKTKNTVANCHKVPQKSFTKKLLAIDVIEKSLENSIALINTHNQNVQFIFTVSPVRHLKDGFIENQISKAHLIAALHKIIKVPTLGARGLFPSYEIMMDELRDYRFYAEDMIHPNNLAINYIWEKFNDVWIAEESQSIMNEVDTIQKGLKHKPFNMESEAHQKFLKNLETKVQTLKKQHSFLEF